MTYREQVQLGILRILDNATKGDPDSVISFDDLVQKTGASLNAVDDAVSTLAAETKVRIIAREGGDGGLVRITALGQDAITDPAIVDDRVAIRERVLRWLYAKAWHDRHAMFRIAEIATDLNLDALPVFCAARYLEQKEWAVVYRLGVKPGDPLVNITSQGQKAVDHPEQQKTPPSGVTQHITFNAPVGQSIVGGHGHTQSAQNILFPQRIRDILDVIAAVRDAVANDVTVDEYTREDADHALKILEGEVVKPANDQDKGRIKHILRKFQDYGPTALALVSQLEALINNRPHF